MTNSNITLLHFVHSIHIKQNIGFQKFNINVYLLYKERLCRISKSQQSTFITITILDIIHRPVFYLEHDV
jgi:hypothetical protein